MLLVVLSSLPLLVAPVGDRSGVLAAWLFVLDGSVGVFGDGGSLDYLYAQSKDRVKQKSKGMKLRQNIWADR